MAIREILVKRIRVFSWFVMASAMIQVLALLFRSNYFMADLLSHFALCAWIVITLQMFLSSLCRDYRMLGVLFGLWCIVSVYVSEYGVRQRPLSHDQAMALQASSPEQFCNLRLMSFNVLTQNEKKDDLIAYILANEVDVLILLEINDTWLSALERLSARFPYKTTCARSDNFGIALYSIYPIAGSVLTQSRGDVSIPYIEAAVQVRAQARPVQVYAVHTLPPLTTQNWNFNQQYLAHCLSKIAETSQGTHARSSILLGDLNATPTSHLYQLLQKSGYLVPAGAGRLVSMTWGPPMACLLQLDHVFVSPDLRVLSDAIGPRLGSDHRPILTDILIELRPLDEM